MFAGLVREAKAAASGLLLKYVARASVAVPFAIALGFALAAITVMLVQWFGHVTAYWIMAAGLTAAGLIAAAAVSIKEEQEEKAEEVAEQTDTQEVISEAAQAVGQAPFALLSALAAAPGGATSMLPVVRLLVRNLPLVLLLVIIGALFWPTEPEAQQQTGETEEAEDEEELGRPTPLRPVAEHHPA